MEADPLPYVVAKRLAHAAERRHDRPALVDDHGAVTYGELDAEVSRGTAALQSLGVRPGDRVAIIIGSSPMFVQAFFAALRAGAAAVPLLPGLAADELRHAIVDSGARVVLCASERIGALRALGSSLSGVRHLVAVGGDDPAGWQARVAAAGPPRQVEIHPDDVAVLMYTSGTTGRPLGAILTHRNLTVNQDQTLAGRLPIDAGDVVVIGLPLAHIFALNVGVGTSVAVGATLVIGPTDDADVLLDLVVSNRATAVVATPGVYAAWLDSGRLEQADLGALRRVISGAAPLGVQDIERFASATGLRIQDGYGLTEASPSIASTAMLDDAPPGSVGLPVPDVEVRLVGDDGGDVLAGDVGEIWVRGPNVFRGYWNDPVATAATLTSDRWLRTGDVGTRDENGVLYLVDRLDDLVIVEGFSVYPGEVERVLIEDPSVAQAGVVGVPHPVSGESIVAYVVPAEGHEIDTDALHRRAGEHLARYKRPSRIDVVDALPYTASGKVRRMVLRGDR